MTCRAPRRIAGKRVRITCRQAAPRAVVTLRRGGRVVARGRTTPGGAVRLDRKLRPGRYVLTVGRARLAVIV